MKLHFSVLLARVAELEAQLKTNSNNSNKLPSSDDLKKKPAFSRKKGGRRGGKLGHSGNTLKFVDKVDHDLVHLPNATRCDCGCELVQTSVSEEKR